MKQSLIIWILSLFLFAACEDDKVSGDPIVISQVGQQISLINQTENTLYYFLVDQDILALILWAPSVLDNQPRLAPRGQARIDLTDIFGYSDQSSMLILYYWEAVAEADTLVPGPIEQIFYEL